MNRITPYLTFNGNCREAMVFYQKCLGGKLDLMTLGESPMADRMPKEMQDCILHASLQKSKLRLTGSDMVGGQGLLRGNAVSLLLDCESEAEIRGTYDKLAASGNPTHPLENTFWGALFGGLTDQYGNYWLLHFGRNTFLSLLAAPARRALENNDISTLQQLSKYSEAEILAFHGMGKSSIPKLRAALKESGLFFKN